MGQYPKPDLSNPRVVGDLTVLDDVIVRDGGAGEMFIGDVGWSGIGASAIAHATEADATGYALLVGPTFTFLNVPAGGTVALRVENSNNDVLFDGTRLTVDTELDLNGTLNHDGAAVGFNGNAPVGKAGALANLNAGITVNGVNTVDLSVLNPTLQSHASRINSIMTLLRDVGLLTP